MTVYAVGLLSLRNTDWQAAYQAKLPAVLAKHGGAIVAAKPAARLEGEGPSPDRVILFSFPDADAARAWHADPDHAPLVALRQSGASLDLFLLA